MSIQNTKKNKPQSEKLCDEPCLTQVPLQGKTNGCNLQANVPEGRKKLGMKEPSMD